MHVGTREIAEEIIGNVVVECYDYDEVIRKIFEIRNCYLDLFRVVMVRI
jgi:hypothetical protein